AENVVRAVPGLGLDDFPGQRAQRQDVGDLGLRALRRPQKPFERVSLGLVGRVGKAHAVICSGVTARRSKMMSASGASSRNVSAIFSPASTPEGSRSPK